MKIRDVDFHMHTFYSIHKHVHMRTTSMYVYMSWSVYAHDAVLSVHIAT